MERHTEFVAEWERGWAQVSADIALTLGIEPVRADDEAGEVVLSMPFKPQIAQVTGYFSAGALIQLADVAATAACHRAARRRDGEGAGFPYAVQMSANLLANTDQGRAVATARLMGGRSVMTVETQVRDEAGKLLLLLTSTHVLRQATR